MTTNVIPFRRRKSIPCVRCGTEVERARRCFAVPHCHKCLPPPPPIPVLHVPLAPIFEFVADTGVVHVIIRNPEGTIEIALDVIDATEICANFAAVCAESARRKEEH